MQENDFGINRNNQSVNTTGQEISVVIVTQKTLINNGTVSSSSVVKITNRKRGGGGGHGGGGRWIGGGGSGGSGHVHSAGRSIADCNNHLSWISTLLSAIAF